MNSQTSRKLLIALFICGIAVESGRAQGERRSALPVRIIDGSTGKPISGARVFVDEARPPGGGGWGKGRNRLHIAVDGIWNYEPRRDEPTGTELVFRAEAEGYRPALGRTVVGEAPAGLTIRLEKAPRIEGRIVNADGTPAHGARFRVFDDMAPRLGPLYEPIQEKHLGVVLALADEWGRFSLSPQIEENDDFIAASGSGVAMGKLDDLEGAGGIVTLQPYALIEGAVFVDGEPAAGLPLTMFSSFIEPGWLRFSKRPGVERFDTETENFRFEFPKNWPWGEAEIVIGAERKFAYQFHPIPGESCYLRYDIPSEWENLPGDAKIQPKPVPVLLRVTLPDGAVVTDPELHFCWRPGFDSTPAHIYKDGRLRFAVPPGGDILRISHLDGDGVRWFGEPRMLNFSGDEPGELDIELSLPVSVSGKLELPADFDASTDGCVIAVVKIKGFEPWRTNGWKAIRPIREPERSAGAFGADWAAIVTTGPDGSFTVPNLPPGEVALYAWAGDQIWLPREESDEWNGEPLKLGVVEKDRAGVAIPMTEKRTRTVRVLNRRGEPLENFQVNFGSRSESLNEGLLGENGFPLGTIRNPATGRNGKLALDHFTFREWRFFIGAATGTDEKGELESEPLPPGELVVHGQYRDNGVSPADLGNPIRLWPGQEIIEIVYPAQPE